MADQADADDELFVDDAPQGEEDQDQGLDQDDSAEGEQDPPGDDEEAEVVIGFGDEEPASETDTGLVRQLRTVIEDKNRELRELRSAQPPAKPVEAGPKPTLSDEGIDYDEEKFESALSDWMQRKAKADEAAAQENRGAEQVRQHLDQRLERIAADKAKLKFPDTDLMFETVGKTLSKEQIAPLIMTAKNAAALIYALGKSPERLNRLKAIDNPFELAVAVSELEKELKVTTRRRAPEPEGVTRGTAPLSIGKDKQLERLEKEADRTGDRTKLIAYRKQLNSKGGR